MALVHQAPPMTQLGGWHIWLFPIMHRTSGEAEGGVCIAIALGVAAIFIVCWRRQQRQQWRREAGGLAIAAIFLLYVSLAMFFCANGPLWPLYGAEAVSGAWLLASIGYCGLSLRIALKCRKFLHLWASLTAFCIATVMTLAAFWYTGQDTGWSVFWLKLLFTVDNYTMYIGSATSITWLAILWSRRRRRVEAAHPPGEYRETVASSRLPSSSAGVRLQAFRPRRAQAHSKSSYFSATITI